MSSIVEEIDLQEPAAKKIKLEGSPKGEVNPDSKVEEIIQPRGESDVGITEYISSHAGFSGILKYRFSDFIVHEIDTEGNVVHLTTLECPQEEVPEIESSSGILSEEVMSQLGALKKGSKETVSIDVTDLDKAARKAIHQAIRQNYSHLMSDTREEEGRKVIVAQPQGNPKGQRSQWPPTRGNYLHFILYKENLDTMDAIAKIAGHIRMNPSSFSYAGTKDRRAKTTQWVAAYRLKAETLAKLNHKLRNMTTGNYTYKPAPLKFGDSLGNRFTLVLRDVRAPKEELVSAVEVLKTLGFINYYGMQRFGNADVPTHKIGLALITQQWEEVVKLILQPRSSTSDMFEKALRIWSETRDAEKAWDVLPVKSCIEGHLLRGLKSSNGKDYVKALGFIARNTRLMYLHSYQSYVWNRVTSRRIKELGLKPVVGDLWQPDKEDPRTVTEEDIAQGKVTIHQIVLPLPGHSVTYPQHPELMAWYQEILAQDGLTLTSFDTNAVKTYALCGTYRNIVTLPSNVEWDLVPYDDPALPLFPSDLDLLNNLPQPERPEQAKHKALTIQFSLGTGSYATMALRELLKMDTSHAALKESSVKIHQ
ncbi:PUS7 [Cordylochernes scorpioides]|uniref:PUS7 n=1 Tax=Cordylochernes scorpioides TaxID=51811 RepID=A0ABY6L8Y5_9ARAC|nr:PUS7 [Cordylochernes scorpioides]